MADTTHSHFKDRFLVYQGQQSIKCKSDSELHQAALEDPDAQPQTKKELEKFKRVNPFSKKN